MGARLIFAASIFAVYGFSAHSLQNGQDHECLTPPKMRVAVIGAGVGGLTSIRHLSKEIPDAEIVGFDLNSDVGGTWIYNDRTGTDEFGIPLMSSMYKSLRTNLPKNVMEFPDFPVPAYYRTFMDHNNFLAYLQNYSKAYNLHKYIKFRHIVNLVKFENEKWIITYQNLVTGETYTEIFDYVIVANGHYSELAIPEYKGLEKFQGTQLHSHNYRTAEKYANRTVLVIGSGPSGLDISINVAKYAKKLILSHHNKNGQFKTPFPPNYVQRPDVAEFTENSVVFADGSVETIDDILFCTGYAYHCPFLDSSCGIEIQRTFMYPLYRHVVNANRPTMFFIGIPQLCCAIPMMDLQSRYAVAAIAGKFELPSREKMLNQLECDYKMKDKGDYKLDRIATHTLGKQESVYYAELAAESGVKALPPVFCAIRYATMSTKSNLYTFRNYNYRIIDEEHYVLTYGEGSDDERRTVYDSEVCEMPVKRNRTNSNEDEKKGETELAFDFIKVQNDSLSFNDIGINKYNASLHE